MANHNKNKKKENRIEGSEESISYEYEEDIFDVLSKEEENLNIEMRKESPKKLLEECEKVRANKGIGCIEGLLECINNWSYESVVKYGLYRDTTTNRIEGFFGNLKEMIHHEKTTIKELVTIIKSNAISKMSNSFIIDIPE